MKEYKCDKCAEPCFLQVDNDAEHPMWCPYSDLRKVCNWHEVVDSAENAHATNDQFGNSEQLPDWCKVERHGYDNEQKRYFEVIYIDKKWIDIEYLDDGNGATCDYADIAKCSEARKRPFNSKEMKNLAGIFATTFDGDVSMITDYDWFAEKVRICGDWLCAEELMESTWRVYNKPCYKLEHLENGEWVE